MTNYPDAGWLAPDGTYYPCTTGMEYKLHQEVAQEIVGALYPDAVIRDYQTGYYTFLWSAGYYKVDVNEVYGLSAPTEAQIETLKLLYFDPMARWINTYVHNTIGIFLAEQGAL